MTTVGTIVKLLMVAVVTIAFFLVLQLFGMALWTGTIQPLVERMLSRLGPQWGGGFLLLGGLFVVFFAFLVVLIIFQRE